MKVSIGTRIRYEMTTGCHKTEPKGCSLGGWDEGTVVRHADKGYIVRFDSKQWNQNWHWNGAETSLITILARPFDKQIKDYLLHNVELDDLKEAADV